MKGKTQDGHQIGKVKRAAIKVGVTTRQGGDHYLLQYPGIRPCPLGESTNLRKMVVPWMQNVTGLESERVYTALRTGKW